MNKKHMGLMVLICGLVAFAIASFAVWLYANYEFGQQDYYYEGSEAFIAGDANLDASNLKSIEIDWLNGDVEIVAYDGTEIQIFESNSPSRNDDKLHYHLNKSGYLQVKYFSSRQNAGIYQKVENKKLTIKVPQSINLKDLQITVTTGNASFENISIEDKLYITVITGNVDLNNCKVNRLFCDVTTGNISDNNSSVQQLEVGVVTGDMSLAGNYVNVDGGVTTGNITLASVDATKVKLTVTTGNMFVDLNEDDNFTVRYLVETGKIDFGTFAVQTLGASHVQYGDGTMEMILTVRTGNIQFK